LSDGAARPACPAAAHVRAVLALRRAAAARAARRPAEDGRAVAAASVGSVAPTIRSARRPRIAVAVVAVAVAVLAVVSAASAAGPGAGSGRRVDPKVVPFGEGRLPRRAAESDEHREQEGESATHGRRH
jgi:hypothetical protein